MKSEYKKISELRNWDKNPRNIKEKDFQRLKKQIEKLGQYKPLLVTKDGEVIGGNMRLRAYQELKIEDVWVSVIEPKDETEKLRYALSDNDRAGYYDSDLLANLMPQFDINWEDYAVDLKEPITLNDLFPEDIIEDSVPEVPEGEAESKLGEVYQLGRHRLMCGDSTKIEDVEKLMDGKKAVMIFTDPPYNQGFSGGIDKEGNKSKSGKNEEMINDKMSKEEYKQFTTQWIGNMLSVLIGSFYICYYRLMTDVLMEVSNAINLDWKTIIIWKKNRPALSPLDYHNNYEPILYGYINHLFYGDKTQEDIWDFPRPLVSDLHPTMKPVELMAKGIRNSSKQDDIVLDLFGGSGSTLIACEQTNRICYMMEIDPRYADVIRKRYDNFIQNNK